MLSAVLGLMLDGLSMAAFKYQETAHALTFRLTPFPNQLQIRRRANNPARAQARADAGPCESVSRQGCKWRCRGLG